MKCKIEREREALVAQRSKITKDARRSAFRRRTVVPCAYCGLPLTRESATGDHIHPVSKGGVNKRKNIAISCSDCNSRKGSMEVNEFKKLLGRKGRR